VVTLTLNLSGPVTVAGGKPTLTLNDGGTATYTGGSGSSALTFSYTVAAGQNTPDLKTTAVNLNGATIKDAAGDAANLSLSGITQGSPQIDTTAPTTPVITGDTINANHSITLAGTGEANTRVRVYDGSTELGTTTVSAQGTWKYTTAALKSGTHVITATATDAAGNTSAASNAVDPVLTHRHHPSQNNWFTNGAQGTPIALLGHYIASSFAVEAGNSGGTLGVNPASQSGHQSLLVIPHHS